jgi:DNA-binding GntR family transcriptional regulator
MISEDSPEHPYVQLAGILREQVKRGKTGRLPSVTELAETYDVSPATVKRALGVLRKEGLVRSVRGRGTFVV